VAVGDWGWAPSEFWNASPQEYYLVASQKIKALPAHLRKKVTGSMFDTKTRNELKDLLDG
jgi:hypothetical protein